MNAPAKRVVTLPLDEDLARRAEAAGTDLPRLLEAALKSELAQTGAPGSDNWCDANPAAVESYRRYTQEHGFWSDEYRSF